MKKVQYSNYIEDDKTRIFSNIENILIVSYIYSLIYTGSAIIFHSVTNRFIKNKVFVEYIDKHGMKEKIRLRTEWYVNNYSKRKNFI